VAQQTDRILEIQDGMLLQDVRNGFVETVPAAQMELAGQPAPSV